MQFATTARANLAWYEYSSGDEQVLVPAGGPPRRAARRGARPSNCIVLRTAARHYWSSRVALSIARRQIARKGAMAIGQMSTGASYSCTGEYWAAWPLRRRSKIQANRLSGCQIVASRIGTCSGRMNKAVVKRLTMQVPLYRYG